VGQCGLSPRRLRSGLISAGVMSLWRDGILHVHIRFIFLFIASFSQSRISCCADYAGREGNSPA
jgi:hypothetical protein